MLRWDFMPNQVTRLSSHIITTAFFLGDKCQQVYRWMVTVVVDMAEKSWKPY